MKHCVFFWGALAACSGSTSTADSDEVTDADSATDTGAPTSVDVPPAFQSGSRLEALVRDGGPDAAILERWEDTERGVNCILGEDRFSTPRCLPDEPTTVIYLEPGCREPAIEWPSCDGSAPPDYVTHILRGCPFVRTGSPYEVGSQVEVTYAYRSDTCERFGFGAPTPVYRVTPAPLEDFVSYTVEHVRVDGTFGVRNMVGSDGSSQLTSLVATGVDRECRAVTLGRDFERYCLHGDWAFDFGNTHADPGCTGADAVGTATAETCEGPAYAMSYAFEGECNRYVGTLREIGSTLKSSEVYIGEPGYCFPAEEGRPYWEIGAPAGDVLPRMQEGPAGKSRLQLHHWLTDAGTPLMPSAFQWTDTELDQVCGLHETIELGPLCLPSVRVEDESNGHFADASCTQRVVVWSDDPCFPSELPSLWASPMGSKCGGGGITDVRTIGARHDGPVYFGGGTGCKLVEPGPTDAHYLVGAPVDLTTYAPLPRSIR